MFLLVVVAAVVFIIVNRVPDRSVEELKVRWALPPSQFVEIRGMKVHLRDEGPREDSMPIVLLHGTSSSLHTWDGWVDALKDEHRVIRFDMPAFGLTGPSPDNNELIDRYFDLTTRVGNRQALASRFRQTQPGSLAKQVPELKLPTLILWGGRDRLISPEIGERFHREIVGSRLVRFNELGHVPQEEDPTRTVTALKEFLAQPGRADVQ